MARSRLQSQRSKQFSPNESCQGYSDEVQGTRMRTSPKVGLCFNNSPINVIVSFCRVNDPSREQEYKDAEHLSTWKSALKGKNRVICSPDLRDYLDENIPGWRDDHRRHRRGNNDKAEKTTTSKETITSTALTAHNATNSTKHAISIDASVELMASKDDYKPNEALHAALTKANEIVKRCRHRSSLGLPFLPRNLNGHQDSSDLILEQIDALMLIEWKKKVFAEGEGGEDGLPWELQAYLDNNLAEWMTISDKVESKVDEAGASSKERPPLVASSYYENGSISDSSGGDNDNRHQQGHTKEERRVQRGVAALLQLNNGSHSPQSQTTNFTSTFDTSSNESDMEMLAESSTSGVVKGGKTISPTTTADTHDSNSDEGMANNRAKHKEKNSIALSDGKNAAHTRKRTASSVTAAESNDTNDRVQRGKRSRLERPVELNNV